MIIEPSAVGNEGDVLGEVKACCYDDHGKDCDDYGICFVGERRLAADL